MSRDKNGEKNGSNKSDQAAYLMQISGNTYDMKRYCLALDLKDDPELIAQYEMHHRAVWPEVLESIRVAGIEDMQIYRTGNRLFMIMEVNEQFDGAAKAAADATNPRIVEWETFMDTFQQRLPWAAPNQKWVPMEEIFGLNK